MPKIPEYSSRYTKSASFSRADAKVNIHDFSSYIMTPLGTDLVAHGRGTPLASLVVGSLSLRNTLGQDLSVLVL